MFTTSQHYIRDSAEENHAANPPLGPLVLRSEINPHIPCAEESAATLTSLLALDTLELGRISDEIRIYSGLEDMVMRLSRSLMLSPDLPPGSVEGAAILLGADRLRVLVHSWILIEKEKTRTISAQDRSSYSGLCHDAGERQEPLLRASPESLYLTTFLHLLGLDASAPEPFSPVSSALLPAVNRERVPGLTDILMRDFISLIPFLDAIILKGCRDQGAEIAERLFRKEL